ncbi:RNA methyltransferase [Granulosicoccaceae sp. 1_MG-2023]|nr:RNA methyltransferase [Granulosicoccaceae sp. 1_MG-2023]
MKPSVRIVLVNTTHAGNVGGVARAMKNMGLAELYLVQPCKFRTYDGYARASGANDIMDNAVVCEDLTEALSGCTHVYGTSARSRTLEWEDCSARECAAQIGALGGSAQVAIVFGRERSGLTNEELALCHHRVYIPTDPSFASLNLAAAVQLLSYEIRMALEGDSPAPAAAAAVRKEDEPAPADAMAHFYTHLESTLVGLGFLDPENPRQLMRRLRKLYQRAHPTRSELAILRGILSLTDKAAAKDR